MALWDENISCHISKQEISEPSVTSGLQMWMRAPQTVIPQCVWIQHHFAEELGERKKPGERDRTAEVHVKGMRVASSRAQNAKSLADTWSLPFRLPAPFVANLYIAWLSPASVEQFSQSF